MHACNDIFGRLNQQITATKVWCKIFKVWKIKLEVSKLSPSGPQAHQPSGQSDSYASISTQAVDSPYLVMVVTVQYMTLDDNIYISIKTFLIIFQEMKKRFTLLSLF